MTTATATKNGTTTVKELQQEYAGILKARGMEKVAKRAAVMLVRSRVEALLLTAFSLPMGSSDPVKSAENLWRKTGAWIKRHDKAQAEAEKARAAAAR